MKERVEERRRGGGRGRGGKEGDEERKLKK
jgi:hypothetical protein